MSKKIAFSFPPSRPSSKEKLKKKNYFIEGLNFEGLNRPINLFKQGEFIKHVPLLDELTVLNQIVGIT
ncbi:MAG: hypothetical protein JWP00_3589 [Chloroflexi bacterium]|nr:hypothetical protein [Chloroflexota bacterium]